MRILVICKIADRQLRKKLFARLANRGASPALGVFECDIGDGEFERLRKYMRGLPYGERDRVTIYPICAGCHKKRDVFGGEPEQEAGWVII